ncbi:MAG: DMT family transporter [Promethearchaeota archaeon]
MDSEKTGTFIIIIGLFVYGVHPVLVEFGTLFVPPLIFASVAALLTGGMAVALRVAKPPRMQPSLSRSDILRLVMAGVLGTFLAYTGLFLGLQLTSSNNAGVILRSELAFALLFGYLFLDERISFRQAVWMCLMIIGVFFVIATTQLSALSVGDLLILVTPIAWAGAHTFAKPVLQRVSVWTAVGYRNLVGGALLALLASTFIAVGIPIYFFPHLWMIVAVIFLEAVVILLAHSLWYAGIRRINLGKATALIAPAPLVTFFLSLVVFQVLPTPWQLIGALLVIIATILLSREVSLHRTLKDRSF